MKSICVFCGASPGNRSEYMQAARELGLLLTKQGFRAVYGGGNVGMMGEFARSMLDAGGEVVGVIPRGLVEREVALTNLPDLRVVSSMHERKALMVELSDAFIALPGGLGTLEEIFEALTWGQLGIHRKPCGFLNICGYYDKLLAFLDHVAEEHFIELEHRAMFLLDRDPVSLLEKLAAYQHPQVDKAKRALSKLNRR